MSSPRLAIEVFTARSSMFALVPLEHVIRRPFSIGARADVAVRGAGLADEHLYVLVRHGCLLVASAETVVPAVIDAGSTHAVISSVWLAVAVPARIRVGEVLVRFSWCERPSTVDRADDATPKIARRPRLPPVSPPPRRSGPPSRARASFPNDEITLVSHDTSTITARIAPADRPERPEHEPPPSRPTLVAPLAPPMRPMRARAPQTAPQLAPRPEREVATSPPPLTTPRSRPAPPARLARPACQHKGFAIASRAVDAWNRFVDAVDERDRRARQPHDPALGVGWTE